MEPIEMVTSAAYAPAMRQSIWKNIPTAGQLADPNDVFALIWKTHRAMSELGLSEATVRHYTDDGLTIILNRYYDIGTDRFSEEILDQIVRVKRFQYEKGQISRTPYQNLRKSAYWVREMYRPHYSGEDSEFGAPAAYSCVQGTAAEFLCESENEHG